MDQDKFTDKGQNKIKSISNEIKCRSTSSIENNQIKATTNTVSSVSSIRPKKSSSLLSAFRRNKKKIKKSDTLIETINISSQNLEYTASNSSLGLHTEEDDIVLRPVDKVNGNQLTLKSTDENLHATDSEHSVRSNTKVKSNFFRNLIKKQSTENMKKKSEQNLMNSNNNVPTGESNQCCSLYRSDSSREFTENEHGKNSNYAITSYVNFGKSTLTITLANGLQSVQELASRFHESESHLLQILGRYIKDPSLQEELVEILSQHSKLQREAERRTSILANDMWMHQIEIGRAQERTLQETLNSLVKQNRQLQIDNEIMFRKHERLVRKLQSFPESGLQYKCMDCNSQIEFIIKHNENLQEKLDTYVQQIESLENELHILEKQNQGLEQQLKHSSSQINSLRATNQRSKTDYDLELLTLNYELQKNEKHIKESMDAGEALLTDLEGLKRQFKGLPVSINWSKFKSQRKCLTDIINISRSCINDLSKEVLSLHSQISFKEKDIETLQETNAKLQENLKKSTTELDNIYKKLDESSFNEANKIISEQKCKILESDLKAAQEKIENLKMKFELEKSTILSTVPEFENLSKQIAEKDKMIEHTKMFITNITSENLALRNQVDTLNRSLAESGAGDVVKELANCQEQLAYFQSQYYHLLNEKQIYLNEIENVKEDKRAVIMRLEANFKQLQNQLKELEKKNDENSSLRQQYDAEHQTVITLQNERMKYLEEKNMLKTIFQHMKTEIARVQKLECAVADISKEANKLAIIAEYNKQIGEKLKTEVQEKDHTILQLRSSVEKLNDIQIQNTKDKLSLCYELSEVCQMKEQLNNILSIQMQKNMALDDTKKEIFESASCQLKKYEEMHQNEQSAIKDLVRDYKILMNQREGIAKENEKLNKEISDIRDIYKDLLQKYEGLTSANNEKDVQIAELVLKEKNSISVVNSLHEKLNAELKQYEANTKQLEKLIHKLRTEKEELETSVKYLQNNIQKLYYELNESRKNEKETKNLLNKATTEKEEIEKQIIELKEDREKLSNEVNYLNSLCEKVLSDFESSIKSSVEKEEIFKKEIKESKCIILNSSKEIEHLTETVFLKQGEIEKLVMEIEELKEKEVVYNDSVKSFKIQNQELKDIECQKEKLEHEISNLRIEHDSSKRLLDDLKKEIDIMEKELKLVVDQKQDDYMNYKRHLDEVKRKYEEMMDASNRDIYDLNQKLDNERSAYGTLSEIHKEISGKFIKSIKNYTDEKTARQEIEGKLKETLQDLNRTRVEKEDLQQQINILLDGLNDEKNRINTLTQEKKNTEDALEELRGKYNDLLTKCLSLEHQLRGLELGVSNDSCTDISLKGHVELLQKEAKENHELILSLKENITKLQQQITGLEFQKSEMILRLHETQRKCETEESLCEQLRNTHKLVLAALLKMKDEGKLDGHDCSYVLHLVKSKDAK